MLETGITSNEDVTFHHFCYQTNLFLLWLSCKQSRWDWRCCNVIKEASAPSLWSLLRPTPQWWWRQSPSNTFLHCYSPQFGDLKKPPCSWWMSCQGLRGWRCTLATWVSEEGWRVRWPQIEPIIALWNIEQLGLRALQRPARPPSRWLLWSD